VQNNPFQTRAPNIAQNDRIRTPQREAFAELENFAANSNPQEREIGIVLPVGCGKSGCIALAPFAFKAVRTLNGRSWDRYCVSCAKTIIERDIAALQELQRKFHTS
jgi:hypothetical protein